MHTLLCILRFVFHIFYHHLDREMSLSEKRPAHASVCTNTNMNMCANRGEDHSSKLTAGGRGIPAAALPAPGLSVCRYHCKEVVAGLVVTQVAAVPRVPRINRRSRATSRGSLLPLHTPHALPMQKANI